MDSMKLWLNICTNHVIYDFATKEDIKITADDVFVVWSCKTLKNKKALLSTAVSGNTSYYEFTYDGEHERTHIDKYKKISHTTIYDAEFVK